MYSTFLYISYRGASNDFTVERQCTRLTEEQKCEYLLSYCKEREAKFILTLDSYEEGN